MGYIGAGLTRFNTADELTVTGDAEFDGNLTVKGTHITLDSATVQTVDLGDNDKIRLGDGDDLQIYHSGNDSYILDSGTGDLYLAGENNVRITSNTGLEAMATLTANGAVTLYYDNAAKLATTSTGVDAINTAGSSTSRFGSTYNTGANDGTLVIGNGGSGKAMLRFDYEGTNTDRARIGVSSSAQQLEFYTAGNNERMRIDSSGNVGIGKSPVSAMLDVNGNVKAGNGTASAPAYSFQGSSAIGMYTPDSGFSVAFGTGGSERLRIDASGNAFMKTANSYIAGTTSLGFYGDAASSNGMFINSSGHITQTGYTQYGTSAIGYIGDASNLFGGSASDFAIRGTSNLTFGIGASEKMRIDSSGRLLVGNTGYNIGQNGVYLQNAGSVISRNTTSGATQVNFANPNGVVGTITTSGTSTAYNTSSDYRLKENVVADWDATTRLKQLNPVRFNFIADADTTVDGFLAHEVADIVPEAITGTKDAMMDEEYQVSAATGDIYTLATDDADEVIHSTDVEQPEELAEGQQWRETTAAVMGTRSVPNYQGIDQSKLVPLLCKTILELEARIAALETA